MVVILLMQNLRVLQLVDQPGLDEGKYCRTELREFWKGIQSSSDNWKMTSGAHILESKLKVDFINSTKKELYVAQIHGKGDGNPATVKVLWKNGKLLIEYYTKPDSGTKWTNKFIKKPFIGEVGHETFIIKLKIENGILYYGLVCEKKGLNIDYTE